MIEEIEEHKDLPLEDFDVLLNTTCTSLFFEYLQKYDNLKTIVKYWSKYNNIVDITSKESKTRFRRKFQYSYSVNSPYTKTLKNAYRNLLYTVQNPMPSLDEMKENYFGAL